MSPSGCFVYGRLMPLVRNSSRPPLTRFLERYPQLSVQWMLNDKTVNFLSENLDCAIRVGAEVDPATVSVLLAEVPRSIVASPTLLARFAEIRTPQDLAALPWIALSTFTSITLPSPTCLAG